MLVFRHDAFEVLLTGQPKKPFAVLLNMVAVQQPMSLLRHDRAQPLLPPQRQAPQVFIFAPEQVESDKAGSLRRKSRSRNCGLPSSSRHTISPSSTADRARSFLVSWNRNEFGLEIYDEVVGGLGSRVTSSISGQVSRITALATC